MADTINILVKKPDGFFTRKTIPYDPDDPTEFQKIVEGYIEVYYLGDDTVIICNEEGWLDNLPPNCEINGNPFCGTIIMCKTKEGKDGEEFASIW